MKKKNDVQAFMTLEEIANIEGVSTQRIQQIEQRALKKIREYLLKRFGNSVTINDILPSLNKGDYYESLSCL